jgi:hypothetical protein
MARLAALFWGRGVSIKRRNRISGQFAVRLIEMLESPAWCVLSLSARRVIERLEIELAAHGGNDNGALPVTYGDFVAYGIGRDCVGPAIREAEALGFIRVTEHGRGGNAEDRQPNKFFITFAHCRGSLKNPPTHDWRKFKTVDEAVAVAKAARGNKDIRAVGLGSAAKPKRKPKRKTSRIIADRCQSAKMPTENEESSVG